jgi:exopolyphosphatase/guanosine-5'-triphosphate,3'-diphosphate pyrophosphatase
VSERLARSSHAERLRMPGIRRRRADLLPTGALVLTAAAELLDLDGYTLTDWGLREGVLLEALEVD